LTIEKNEKHFDGKLGSVVRYDLIYAAMQEFFINLDTDIITKLMQIAILVTDLLDSTANMAVTQLKS
jgi:hypothetical protein